MTPLRKQMVNDMTVRGLAENTKKSYLNSVSGLACHYGRKRLKFAVILDHPAKGAFSEFLFDSIGRAPY